MSVIDIVLLVVALICLAIAAFNVPVPRATVQWGWLGMGLFVLTFLTP